MTKYASKGKKGVGFAIRAGMVVSQDSVSEIKRLIDTAEGGFAVVITEPADRESRNMIEQFVDTVGSDKVIVSLEKEDVKDNSLDIRIPQPRSSDSTNGCEIHKVTSVLMVLVMSMVVLL